MNSIECRSVLNRVHNHLKQVNYNPDLYKLYNNLEELIQTISKTEVECRRSKNYKRLEKPIKDFNDAVDRLEKLILIAKLID